MAVWSCPRPKASQYRYQIAARRETLFPINSATKSFTGVVVTQLFEARKVDLEHRFRAISMICPKVARIRIRQLLAHS